MWTSDFGPNSYLELRILGKKMELSEKGCSLRIEDRILVLDLEF